MIETLFLLYVLFIAASWQGYKGKLTLHYENGFALHSLKPVTEGDKPKLLWYFPFEKLRMSADDGHRLLWLDFGDDGEQVAKFRQLYNNVWDDSLQEEYNW